MPWLTLLLSCAVPFNTVWAITALATVSDPATVLPWQRHQGLEFSGFSGQGAWNIRARHTALASWTWPNVSVGDYEVFVGNIAPNRAMRVSLDGRYFKLVFDEPNGVSASPISSGVEAPVGTVRHPGGKFTLYVGHLAGDSSIKWGPYFDYVRLVPPEGEPVLLEAEAITPKPEDALKMVPPLATHLEAIALDVEQLVESWRQEEGLPVAIRDRSEEIKTDLATLRDRLGSSYRSIQDWWQRHHAIETLQQQTQELHDTWLHWLRHRELMSLPAYRNGWVVGSAGSFQKIPRALEHFEENLRDSIELKAAGNEMECAQIIVIALGRPLENVEVSVSPLVNDNDSIIEREAISLYRVGYINTMPTSYSVNYTGDWPDPLMPLTVFDVSSDSIQPVWLEIVIPVDAEPGRYRGQVTVGVADDIRQMPITIEVFPFTLPTRAPIPCTSALSPSAIAEFYYGKGRSYQHCLDVEDYRRFAACALRYKFTPFELGTAYVEDPCGSPDLNTSNLPVVLQNLRWAKDRGATLTNVFPGSFSTMPRDKTVDLDEVSHSIEEYHGWLEKKGLLEDCMAYFFDEPHLDWQFSRVEKMGRLLHRAAPRLRRLCTIHPQERWFGLVDIWVPSLNAIRPSYWPIIRDRQEIGEEVWWYVCGGNLRPNILTDHPSVDVRAIFWAMWKYRINGFLYWSMAEWHTNAVSSDPDGRWPNIPWNPLTFPKAKCTNDGMLIYPGPNLQPIPSLRMAQIRDAIEDYQYLHLLNELCDRLPIDAGGNVRALKSVLSVVDEVIYGRSPRHDPSDSYQLIYSDNPEEYLQGRCRLAQAIIQAQTLIGNGPD